MTREEDARQAAVLGAGYVGAIMTESPRQIAPTAAVRVLGAAHGGVRRVGVFGADPAEAIARNAKEGAFDVVQLHGDPSPADVEDLRKHWSGPVWAAIRVGPFGLPRNAAALFDTANAVILDARVEGKLGGAGIPFVWDELQLDRIMMGQRRARFVLAGGLTPANVAQAIDELEPDIVDVSSGVESSPGVKDHGKMRAFRDAVRGGSR
ncbi:MAG: phosphoribosylanthranilate isomerase [Gemmatimonadota bacterium]